MMKLSQAENRQDLIQLTVWRIATNEEIEWLEKECKRINSDPTRVCYIVVNGNSMCLYVNRVA